MDALAPGGALPKLARAGEPDKGADAGERWGASRYRGAMTSKDATAAGSAQGSADRESSAEASDAAARAAWSAPARPLRVAVAQLAPTADAAANRARLVQLAERAAESGARLLVAPEYASFFDGAPSATAAAAAEPLDGPFVSGLRETASRLGIAIAAGLVERAGDAGRFRNAIVVASPEGELAAVYRKVHLYDAFGARESDFVEAGDAAEEPVCFELDGVRIGIQTCYDLRFPESTRRLAAAGAELVLVPAQWVPGPLKEHHWTTLLAARAIESTVAVAAADHPATKGVGLSRIVGPDGVLMAGLGAGEGLATADVDPEAIRAVRRSNPSLAARRYSVIPREDSGR